MSAGPQPLLQPAGAPDTECACLRPPSVALRRYRAGAAHFAADLTATFGLWRGPGTSEIWARVRGHRGDLGESAERQLSPLSGARLLRLAAACSMSACWLEPAIISGGTAQSVRAREDRISHASWVRVL